MSQPWDFETARRKCRQATKAQEDAEEATKTAYRESAEAEENYRKALAIAIVKAHNDGVAWSVAADIARGDDNVAELRKLRDIAEGVREATAQAGWRHTANRKDAQRFADWSQRREFAEAYGQTTEVDGEIIGRRAA